MASFETIEAKLELATDGFSRGISNAIGGLGSLENKAGSAHKAVGALGVGLAAVAAGGIAKSIDAAADLDAALTESTAIMGDVSDAMREDMSDAAREVAKSTTFAAEEAGESFYFLASAGMDAEQSIEALPTVAEFAQAGMFDLATATDLATDAQSALGLASEDAAENQKNLQRVTDALVKSNTLANASVEQFSEALTNKAAAAMREANIELEEGAAALAVFADQGLKGRRAGTILARTIQGLQSAAQDNSAAFEELGVAVYDAEGNMRPMADIVEDMDTAMADMSTEQRNAAMEQLGLNERAAQGVSLMMGNTEAMREYEGELQNAGGTAGEVADNQLKSFNAQLDLLKSQITDIGIGIGQVFLPPLTEVLQVVTKAVSAFADFNTKLGGMPGAIILVTTLFAGLAMAAGSAAAVLGGTGLAATAATGAIAGLTAALGLLLSPITLIVAAVALLGYAWTQNWGGIQEKTGSAVSKIMAFLQPLLDVMKGEMVKTLRVWAAVARNVLGWMEARWDEHGHKVMAIVEPFLAVLVAIMQEAARTFRDLWVVMWALLRGDTETATDAMDRMMQRHARGLIKIYEWLAGVLTGSTIPDMLNGILSKIRSFSLVDAGKALIRGFARGIRRAAGAATSAVKSVVKKVRDYLPGSDAEEGALDDISQTGPTLVRMIAEGMWSNENLAERASSDIAQAARPEIVPNVGRQATRGQSGGQSPPQEVVVGFEADTGDAQTDELIELLWQYVQPKVKEREQTQTDQISSGTDFI